MSTGRISFIRISFECITNVVPPFVALYMLVIYVQRFGAVVFSVFVAAAATLVVLFLNWLFLRNNSASDAATETQPAFDRVSWIAMAAVLLFSAVDGMSHSLYGEKGGIPWLANEYYDIVLPIPPSIVDLADFPKIVHLTRFDVLSIFFGSVMMCAPSFWPWLMPSRGRGLEERKYQQKIVKSRQILPSMVVSLAGALIFFVLHQTSSDWAPRPHYGPPIKDVYVWFSAAAVFLFYIGYLCNHRTVFDLLLYAIRDGGSGNDNGRQRINDLLWLRNLRRLAFESVVLPSLAASVAVVGGALDGDSALIFGLFVFSGFSVWNISVKVSEAHRMGTWAVLMQFFYSLLMTVLWVVVLWRLQGLCDKEAFKKLFGVVLNVALAAIFIQIVFGPVYRNLWARTLSDRWILESPEYVMVATIVSACVSAMPQNLLKTLMVAIVILVFIVVPAKLFRRSLTAYVLIRVLPGKTEQVRKTLLAADIFSAVLYGDYDVLVKVEVPGRVSPKPGDTFSDERELGELAALVQHQIRSMKEGITETQTLLDFSDFVSIPNDDEERLSRR